MLQVIKCTPMDANIIILSLWGGMRTNHFHPELHKQKQVSGMSILF